MKSYERLTQIDEELKRLRILAEKVAQGDYYANTVMESSNYAYITLKIENKLSSISWNDKVEYKVLASVIIGQIIYEEDKLLEEKRKLLVPWYKRLFTPPSEESNQTEK